MGVLFMTFIGYTVV